MILLFLALAKIDDTSINSSYWEETTARQFGTGPGSFSELYLKVAVEVYAKCGSRLIIFHVNPYNALEILPLHF